MRVSPSRPASARASAPGVRRSPEPATHHSLCSPSAETPAAQRQLNPCLTILPTAVNTCLAILPNRAGELIDTNVSKMELLNNRQNHPAMSYECPGFPSPRPRFQQTHWILWVFIFKAERLHEFIELGHVQDDLRPVRRDGVWASSANSVCFLEAPLLSPPLSSSLLLSPSAAVCRCHNAR